MDSFTSQMFSWSTVIAIVLTFIGGYFVAFTAPSIGNFVAKLNLSNKKNRVDKILSKLNLYQTSLKENTLQYVIIYEVFYSILYHILIVIGFLLLAMHTINSHISVMFFITYSKLANKPINEDFLNHLNHNGFLIAVSVVTLLTTYWGGKKMVRVTDLIKFAVDPNRYRDDVFTRVKKIGFKLDKETIDHFSK